MSAMRDDMPANVARPAAAVHAKCSRFTKLFFVAPAIRQRCSPTSSGSSVDSAITLTGRPFARLYA
jgi:hypothetical protein